MKQKWKTFLPPLILIMLLLFSLRRGTSVETYTSTETLTTLVNVESSALPAESTHFLLTTTKSSIGQLLCEDGTGIINFAMSQEEILDRLNEHRIRYEINESIYFGNSIYFEDGSAYYPGFYYPKETARGISLGDTVEKMKVLYGEPDFEIIPDIGCYSYLFEVGRNLCPDTGKMMLSFSADSSADSAKITSIEITPYLIYPHTDAGA